MDTFKDRLRKAADYAGVEFAPQPIATALGIPRRQTVARWLEGSVPEQEMVFRIASTWKVDPVWLGTGAGDMFPKPPTGLTQKELELLQTYRQLDSAKRSSVFSIVRALAKAVVLVVIAVSVSVPTPSRALHKNNLGLHASGIRIRSLLKRWLQYLRCKAFPMFRVS